ncbi:Hypothetical predicted protein [Mytilus galloprovincialis]|uniref:C3H1-type domain-containing protein n=1 Tax=Mytilus galloprovincialis TaxID=29158 RepID=A0A8B6GJG9_MYTGA|nr:Hypothetical predicted protein [Mytilus galloprovincialis]
MYRRSGRKRVPTSRANNGGAAAAAKKSKQQQEEATANIADRLPRTSGTPPVQLGSNTVTTNVLPHSPIMIPATLPAETIYPAPGNTTLHQPLINTGYALPIETVKASDDIARNVSQNVKQKVINGEYVDMGSLLNNSQNITGVNQTLTFNQGQIILQPKQQDTRINTIGAKRYAGLGWKLYDEQFRLRRSQEPAGSWSVIDTELWLLYMQPAGPINGPEFNIAQKPTNNFLKCYAYNYNGTCTQQYCTYKHACLKCSGVHPVIYCTNSKVTNSNNPQSPGIVQRFRSARPQAPQKTASNFQPFAPRQMQNNTRFRSPGAFMGQRQNPSQN